MKTDPTSLTLAWSPFGNHDASTQNVFAEGLRLGGLAAAPLRFGRAPDDVSLTTDGEVKKKTVVSEVTHVNIRSTSTYNVTTETADNAKAAAKNGTALDETARADGNVDVATADTTNRYNNAGSIEVDTTVTFSDGTTEKSTAYLGDNFRSSGDGLARKRLDAIIGASASIGKILSKLGVGTSDAGPTFSSGASPDRAVEAHVDSNLSVSLTYEQSGDQRSVHGIEIGTANAVIASFSPTDLTYDANGLISTTNESARFSGTIGGGSLFSRASGSWLAGSMFESTSSVTHIPGSTDVTIARQGSANFNFATSGSDSLVQTNATIATQITATSDVANGRGGWNRQQITLSQIQKNAAEQLTSGTDTSSSDQSSQTQTVTVASTPVAYASAFAATIVKPVISALA